MGIIPGFDLIAGPLLVLLLVVFLALESCAPLRQWVVDRLRRLRTNLTLGAIGALAVRLLLVPVVVWVAMEAERRGFGLLRLVRLPDLAEVVLGFALFDYTVYFWHRATHGIPLLWRFHRVHHTDLDLDVSTAFRFHVGELVLSIAARAAQVALLGLSWQLALVCEIAFEAATEFHHSNWRLPLALERRLHRVLVSPRMHGIHHSILEGETNSNWGVVFSWWDHLHRTIRLGIRQDEITIGLPAHRDAGELTFWRLLVLPFARQRPTWFLPDGRRPAPRETADTRQLEA